MSINLTTIFKAWTRILTKPGAQSFAALRNSPAATLTNAIILSALFEVLFSLLRNLKKTLSTPWWPQGEAGMDLVLDVLDRIPAFISHYRYEYFQLHVDMMELYGSLWLHTGIFALCGDFVLRIFSHIRDLPMWQFMLLDGFLAPVRFLVVLVTCNGVAILLGGRGQFGRFAFLVAIIDVVIMSIYAAVGFLPLVTGTVIQVFPGSPPMLGHWWHQFLSSINLMVVFPAILTYWFFLLYFPMRVEHGLTWWRAIVAVMISYFLLLAIETFIPFAIPEGMWEAKRLYGAGG